MNFDAWMSELRKLGENVEVKDLNKPSPWSNKTIGEALEFDDYWIDRFAAGYTPHEILIYVIGGHWKPCGNA